MIGFEIDDAGLKRKLRRVSSALGEDGMRRAFIGIGNKLLREIDENFRTQGQKLAGGWAPLRPSTIRRRLNKKKSTIKILQDTGRLRMSFVRRSVDGKSVVVGTQDMRAPRLNKGDPSRGLVGRRMIHTKDQAKQVAIVVLDAYLKRNVHG